MLRIIGGQFKNRSLKTPRGSQTRPTSGIVRKAIFDICRDQVVDARVLDVFAGSGAIGIEAISRGAASATFIENDRFALHCLRENIDTLEIQKIIKILPFDALKSLKLLAKANEQFEFIYVDPPYAFEAQSLLHFLEEHPILAKEGILCIEEGQPSRLQQQQQGLKQLQFIETRKFGRTLLHLFKRSINF